MITTVIKMHFLFPIYAINNSLNFQNPEFCFALSQFYNQQNDKLEREI